MWRLCLALLLTGAAQAQELSLLAGALEESGTRQRSSAWAVEYQHPLHENVAASFSWLNEGHVPGHHRDGQSVQVWGRGTLFERRLSLAAGLGPYRYFDTTPSSNGGGYANQHGWGTVGSLAATYYPDSRWLYQWRVNRILTRDSTDTNALLFGIGYQLEPMSRHGPRETTPYQPGLTTHKELTLFLGRTIVNSYHSEQGTAKALEYRFGMARHVDATLGLLNEGDARLLRRTGLTAQLWGVREVLGSDRLVLGVGLGPYLEVDRYSAASDDNDKLSLVFTATAAFRFGRQWAGRISWNRINTNYHRDTDVILFGAGYRY